MKPTTSRARRAAGFTLVEVLVSLGLLSLTIVFVSVMVGALRFNVSSSGSLRVNQAAQAYLEAVQNSWRRPTSTATTSTAASGYGVLAAGAPVPASVPNYAWSVSICELDGSYACQNTRTYTTPTATTGTSTTSTSTTSAPTYTASSSAVGLMRVWVVYTPTTSGKGAALRATAEIARP